MIAAPKKVENFRLSAALNYAAMGWKVFPCHFVRTGAKGNACSCGKSDCGSPGKHPITAQGFKDSSSDPVKIANWWNSHPSANIGVATGVESGIVVLDIDPKNGGSEGYEEFCSTHGTLPDTCEVETGGGGRHIILGHPGDMRIPNSSEKLGKGLDVRGDGGYIIAPPSNHISGKRYEFAYGIEHDNIVLAPDWFVALVREQPKEKPAAKPARNVDRPDTSRLWLEKALVSATEGTRSERAHWLACQLRDNLVSEMDAESIMREYARRVPAGQSAYTEREAIATMHSAYKRPARDPVTFKSNEKPKPKSESKPEIVIAGAANELREHMGNIVSGKVANVAFPWPLLTKLTAALLPGSVTCVVGDPGVGKTFWTLQCLPYWIGNGAESAVFFVEKDRKFHTMRMLAQLEGDGRFVDYDWIRGNAAAVEAALAKHAATIDYFGQFIHSAPESRVTLDTLYLWIKEQ